MHNNIAKPYDKFVMYGKILFFLYFHEHKNTKLNQFTSISKRADFKVLHSSSWALRLRFLSDSSLGPQDQTEMLLS